MQEARNIKADAIEFLYSERLENYIEDFGLNINPDWLRETIGENY